MCLHPLKIRSPAKRYSRAGGTRLLLEVPCNKCAECVTAIRSHWYFRTYQEVISTLNHGGYIYFDTLTYSDKYLPHLSDYVDLTKYPVRNFSCFSHSHFKLFLKNLRRQLEYKYGDNSFKYFLTSEYGVDDRYTHRPHYHIMFFVTSKVHPLDFSKLVSKCWKYGRTDGLPYHSIRYVSEHIYGKDLGYGSNDDISALSSVCMYVSKYITKSSKFQKKLDNRISQLKRYISDEEELGKLKRNIDMFHRQSQGFGISYLYSMSADKIKLALEGKCIMPDSKKINNVQPLPMYYKRKLFYKLCKREDKTYYWEYSDSGIYYNHRMLLKSIDDLCLNYRSSLVNMNKDTEQLVYNYLDGRSLSDFAIYNLFYKDRLRLYDTYELGDIEYNLYDWLDILKQSTKCNSLPKYQVYETDDDFVHINPFLDVLESKRTFIANNTFNERVYEFRNFDKLNALFKKHNSLSNKKKQETFLFIEDLKERLKIISNGN